MMIKYAILFLLVSFQGLSAVYNVTRTDDPVPDTCIASECSLREAIIAANDNPGVDTILLDAKSYQLTLTGSDDLSLVGDLDILDELIIQGEAVELTTIDGDLLSDRVFDIKLASDTQINDLAIINGDAGAGFGGAIKINEADLKLNKVFLTDNISRNGGGIFATYSNLEIIDSLINGNHSDSEGGAIFSLEGQFNLQNSYIISNTSSTQGAGIYLGFNQSSTHMPHVAINDSFIINNLSESQGGGISINSTAEKPVVSEIKNTLIWNNRAIKGGGISQFGRIDLSIESSTLIENHADIQGSFDSNGGAIYVTSGPMSGAGFLQIKHSLMADNSALDYAGALWIGGITEVLLENSTISGNSASACGALCAFGASLINLTHITLNKNSTTHDGDVYLADNSISTFVNNIFDTDCTIEAGAVVGSSGGNVESPNNTCGLGLGLNDLVNVHPRFLGLDDVLRNMGGPTKTHVLYTASSVAVGNAIMVPGLSSDQRYFGRDSNPDSGATEQQLYDIDLIFKSGFGSPP